MGGGGGVVAGGGDVEHENIVTLDVNGWRIAHGPVIYLYREQQLPTAQ